MKTAPAVNVRQTAAEIFERTAAIRRESGVAGLAGRLTHRLAAPVVKWGGVTFYERRLDASGGPPRTVSGVYVCQILPDEIDALLEGGDPDQTSDELAERFRRGDRPFAAIAVGGRICHVRWVSTTRVHIPEIDRDIIPGPRQAYFYNGYTRVDARNRGIDGVVRQAIFDTLRKEGFVSVCSYVRTDNRAGIRAASRWQRPVGTVRYVAVRGCKPILANQSAADLPALDRHQVAGSGDDGRVDAWRRWFTSWTGEPLEKRSTGCAALDEAAFHSAAAFIRESLAIAATDNVLDVGCDSAMITRRIAPHVRRLLGVDFIHEMLRDSNGLSLTHAEGGAPWFVTADACRLPIMSAAFSKVYSSAMLHTLPTRGHGLQAIEELIRVATPGGTVLVSSVPDRAKRLAGRLDVWKRARAVDKFTLPIRWLLPGRLRTLGRRLLRRPATGLPEFLDYDLQALARSLHARGFRSEVRDFPSDYWSPEFRTSRSNLIIHIPRN